MMIIALTLLALFAQVAVDVQAGLGGLLSHEAAGNDMAALCEGKRIDLTSFSQLKELDKAVGQSKCAETYMAEIHELTMAIEKGQKDLCSVESIESFINYYKFYVDTSGDNDEELNKSVKRFALAYGLQISNLCKKNMIRALNEEEAGQLIDATDYEEISKLVQDNGPVAQVLDSLGGPDEVFLPGSMRRSLKNRDKKKLGDEKLFLQAETSTHIKQLQTACTRSFKPIYEPLVMPLVRLANIGIDFKDKTLRADLKDQAKTGKTAQWSRIVFLCESFLEIHIVQDEADQEQADGTGKQLVRILTKEEAAQLEASQGVGPQQLASSVEPIVFVPSSRVTLPDLIFDKSDTELVSAVKKVKTNKSEEQVKAKKYKEQALVLLKKNFLKGQTGVVVSAGIKNLARQLRHKHEHVDSPSEVLVKTLDELTSQRAAGSEGAVSHLSYRQANDMSNWISIVLLVLSIAGVITLVIACG